MLTTTQKQNLDMLVDLADSHPEYKGYGLVKGPMFDAARIPILDKGNVVGFLTPRFVKGYWRAGAIFVAPEHRGKGFATKAIKDFFEGNPNKRPARVWIADYNLASQKAFLNAGFNKQERYNAGESILEKGHYYYLGN